MLRKYSNSQVANVNYMVLSPMNCNAPTQRSKNIHRCQIIVKAQERYLEGFKVQMPILK